MNEPEAQVISLKEQQPLALRIAAELVGSFLIFFAIYIVGTLGIIVINASLALVPIFIGLIYAITTALLSHVSSGQFNPAVTVAAMLTSKTKVLDGACYILAQLVGAVAAGALVKFAMPKPPQGTAGSWITPAANGFSDGSIAKLVMQSNGYDFGITLAIIVEVIASLLVVAAAMHTIKNDGTATKDHAATMGLAYAVGAIITFPITGAGLNPARSTGIAIFAQNQGQAQQPLQQLWVFWICPILAAAIVALVLIALQLVQKGSSENESDVTSLYAQGEAPEMLVSESSLVDLFEPVTQQPSEHETTESEHTPGETEHSSVEETGVEHSDTRQENSHQQANAEIGDEQSDSEHNANKGIETN